jgi:hypothetical protein
LRELSELSNERLREIIEFSKNSSEPKRVYFQFGKLQNGIAVSDDGDERVFHIRDIEEELNRRLN